MTALSKAVTNVQMFVTDACNFKCRHCDNESEHPKNHMSLDDFAFLLEKIENPHLEDVTLSGGEPTMNPAFPKMLEKIADFSKEHHDKIKIYLMTNGWFMLKDEQTFVAEAKHLFENGMDAIVIGNDIPHREFSKSNNLNIDYGLVKGWYRLFPNKRIRRIKKALGKQKKKIMFSGSGQYVIPIEAARDMGWSELLRLAGRPADYFFDIRTELQKEYEGWGKIKSATHCYCNIKDFFCDYAKSKKNPSNGEKDSIIEWAIFPDTELNIHQCGHRFPPPLGNLKEASLDELYERCLNNPDYKIIAEEGPQGLARKYTDWKEEEIKERFLERTPCGLCEDVYRLYINKKE